MQKVLASIALAVAVCAGASPALAIRPDFDGEQGIEAHITGGYGSLVSTSERVFQSRSDAVGTPPNALSGSYNLRFGLGYRFTPIISAGLLFQLQGVDTAPFVTATGSDPTSGGAWSLGAYARLYFMPLITGSLSVRRVNLAGPGDTRRFDPWASLGVEYFALARSTQRPGTSDSASWSMRSLSFPITAGFDYRVITELAVGLSVGIAPMATLGMDKTENFLQAGNPTTRTTAIDVATGGNALWFVGVDVRYTLSL